MAEAVRPRKDKKLKTKMKKKSVSNEPLNDMLKESDLSISTELVDDVNNLSVKQKNAEKKLENEKDNCDTRLTINLKDELVESSTNDEKMNLAFGNKSCFKSQIEDLGLVDDLKTSDCKELNKDLHLEPFLKTSSQIQNIKIEPLIEESSIAAPSAPLLIGTKILQGSVMQRCIETEIPVTETLEKEQEINFIQNSVIKPYSEMQLAALYENVQLEEKGLYIQEFLEAEKKTNRSEFYEIAMNYLRAQTNLIGIEREIENIENDYKKSHNEIWTFDEHNIFEIGFCEDNESLEVNHKHSTAAYQSEISSLIVKQLKQVRESIFDAHSLNIYVSEMSKLQVENYLLNVTTASSDFKDLPKNAPIQCLLSEPNNYLLACKNHLKECIGVLFSFCRRNIKDIKFVRDLRNWLSDLIAILLRVATLKDHLFILNHVIRCPAGSGDWASQFIQIAVPTVAHGQYTLGSSMLDHLMTVLATLLQPVEERENFLRHYEADVRLKGDDPTKDSIWILVDSSGEDEEDSTETWHYFKENDIVQVRL